MVYNIAWNEASPVGSSTNASTIDSELQNLKLSLRERLEDIVNDWTNDSVDPKTLAVLDYRGGVSISGAISVVTATPTQVTWTTEDFDVGALVDIGGAPTVMTVPTNGAGLYLLTANCVFAGTTATYCQAQLTAGGNVVAQNSSHTNVATINIQLSMSAIVALVATNTILLTVQHNQGTNLNLNTATMQAVKLI